MKTILNEIDTILESLLSNENLLVYERWMAEYSSKKFSAVNYRNSSNLKIIPTFETNLICLLFEKLKNKDPHCEWPYKSHLQNTAKSNRADIVFLQPSADKLYEVWIELKMWYSLAKWNREKYLEDFEKLKQVVNANPFCIGVFIHFDIKTRKNDFYDFFELLKEQNNQNLQIDNRIIGEKNNFHFVRLIFMQKNDF